MDELLIPLFMPALCAILINAEDKKGAPLSEKEVIDIRDKATVVMVSHEQKKKADESRGYSDIDPENCWYDWQMLRRELGRKPDIDPGARFSKINKDEQEYQQTISIAKNTLKIFRSMLITTSNKKIIPLVKVLLSEPEYEAFMWLIVLKDKKTGFKCEIFELPSNFKTFELGQKINVQDSDVKDWMINNEGNMYGGYSLRYNRSKLSENEQAAFDKHIGVNKYL